jgi:nicotinamidase-related amidase
MTDNLDLVEATCTQLATTGNAITFTAVAEHTGISRTTLYRNPQLRAVIEDHRSHSHDHHTLTGVAAEIAHLRTALEAIADRVRRHEEQLRRLEATTHKRRRKAN